MRPGTPNKSEKFPYCDKARSNKNLYAAWRKVYSNGIRSQSIETRKAVKEFSVNTFQNIDRIYRSLLKNKFVFQPATGVPISRPTKSPRPIVIAPIASRIVQRSILDVLQHDTSIKQYVDTPFSFGGLEDKSVHSAIEIAQRKMNGGAKWYVQSDIKKFFTKIPKQKVIEIVSNFIVDTKFKDLFTEAIKTELENMEKLGEKANLFPIYEIGVAQGCCLSPLIGNILLHDFDEQMNGGGVSCLRYIDDFIILAPTKKKAIAAFKSGVQILNSHGLDAYDPATDRDKARLGKTADGIDFLGCEISGQSIKPNKKSCDRLLKKIDAIISESKRLMLNPTECSARNRSLVDTLKSTNNLLQGWGNQYFYCNDYTTIKRLDYSVNKRLKSYFDFYRGRMKSYNTEDIPNRRRLLGVHLLLDSFSRK